MAAKDSELTRAMMMMINAPGRPLYLAEDDTVLDPWVPAFFVFFILVCGAIYI